MKLLILLFEENPNEINLILNNKCIRVIFMLQQNIKLKKLYIYSPSRI